MSRQQRIVTQFGPALREQRLSRGWSQEVMAARMSARYGDGPCLNASTLSRLESGQRNPSLAMVTRLADELGLEDVARFRFFAAGGYLETIPPEDVMERIIDELEMW